MKNIVEQVGRLCIASALAGVIGCESKPDRGDVIGIGEGTVAVESYRGLDVGQQIEVAQTNYVLIPIGVRIDRKDAKEQIEMRREDVGLGRYLNPTSVLDRQSAMRESVRNDFALRTNLILHNTANGRQRLLLDARGVITRFVYEATANEPSPMPKIPDAYLRYISPDDLVRILQRYEDAARAPSWPAGLILIGLVDADTSGDGLLTDGDATVAYALTLPGDGKLKRLTPAGQHWTGWERSADGESLILRTETKPTNRELPVRTTEGRYYAMSLADLSVVELTPESLVDDAVRAAGVDPQ